MLSRILNRPDLDGTLYGSRASGVLVGSGEADPRGSFHTYPDAGVVMVEPNRPSYTDAQDAAQLAPIPGVARPVQAGAQFYLAAEYADAPELTGEHGVIVGRPALVSWTPAVVQPWEPSPDAYWREPPAEDRPDLCGGDA